MTQTLDRRTFIGAVAAGVVAAPLVMPRVAQAQTAPALVNPSFEIPAIASYQYNPSATGIGWTFSTSSGIQHNNSAWGASPTPDGVQTAFIQNIGTITQTITLDAGSYTLSFQAARRGGQIQPIKVTVDGTQIGSLVSPANASFSPFSIPFSVATTGAHVLRFVGTDGSGDRSTFIDAVTLVASGGGGGGTNQDTLVLGPGGQDNVALGDWSLAGGLGSKTEVGANGAIAFGQGAYAAFGGAVAIGRNSRAMLNDAFVLGQGCEAHGDNGRAAGWRCLSVADQGYAHGFQANDRDIDGLEAYAHGSFVNNSDAGLGVGDAQTCRVVMRARTDDATPTPLTTDGGAPGFNNQMRLPDKSSLVFQWLVVARDIANGNSRSWKVLVMATRGVGASTTVVFAPVITNIANSPGASGWGVSITVDTGTGAVRLNGIGAAGRPIQWVAPMIDGENVG
jgi:hypothetical protein